jgi:hypothetical protein
MYSAYWLCGPGSSVDIATSYGLDGPGIESTGKHVLCVVRSWICELKWSLWQSIDCNIRFDLLCNLSKINWKPYAQVYDPLQAGSIDGTDHEPYDQAIIRALNSEYEPDKRVKGKSDRTIFVTRLYRQTEEDTVMQKFFKFGHIRRFRLVRDIVTGSSLSVYHPHNIG